MLSLEAPKELDDARFYPGAKGGSMKLERKRNQLWTALLALLMIGLVACGAGDTPQAGNIWDSGRFDQSTWQ
jgi:hypothetical protein